MGLKCSVIGHKYGEASVEREREEQGSEVVITIQERETCERCGKTRIVSENKEVTAIETPSDIAGDMVEGDEAESEPAADADETEAAETAEPAATDEDAAVEEAEAEAEESGTAVDAVDPDADDAEILDAEGGSAEESATVDSELDDPSTVESAADTGEVEDTTDPETDDGVIIDDEAESSVDEDRQPGEWPDEPNGGDDDWTPETAIEDESGSDEATAEVEPLGGSAVTVPEGTFQCPECEFSTEVASSSLRAGDFCPECHKGALVTSDE